LARLSAHQEGARFRRRLHPRRQGHGHAHDRILAILPSVADVGDDDLAGIDPDPQLQGDILAFSQAVGVTLGRLLQGQAGQDGPFRVIFVGQRGPKKGDQAITPELIDLAAKAIDFGFHNLEDVIHQRHPGFGADLAEEFGRIGDIGQHHGDVTPLAFQGLGRVGNCRLVRRWLGPIQCLGRGHGRLRHRRRDGLYLGVGVAAHATIAKMKRVGRVTGRTAPFQARTTHPAETHFRRVVKIAIWTDHDRINPVTGETITTIVKGSPPPCSQPSPWPGEGVLLPPSARRDCRGTGRGEGRPAARLRVAVKSGSSNKSDQIGPMKLTRR
jgi:hypothetical protein